MNEYEVSIHGIVRNTTKDFILAQRTSKNGYKKVSINRAETLVHRLVGMRWLPAPTEDGLVIDHIDRDKSNNHASNLRWVSQSNNLLNIAVRHTPRKYNKSTGEHHITIQYNKFNVNVMRGTFRHWSSHDTLEEAIMARDSIIATLPM
jgi:hypothetical protein